MTFALHGICASKGIAIGRVYIVDRGQLDVNEYLLAAQDVQSEVERFLDAVAMARNGVGFAEVARELDRRALAVRRRSAKEQ